MIEFIHEQGLRENNEDAFLSGTIGEEAYFLVCDGVGGAQNGEIASYLACKTIEGYINTHNLRQSSEAYFNTMIEAVDTAFDDYYSFCPEAKGMGTTLAALFLSKEKAYAIHIGDSRIYHIRKREILYESVDHSLVNELIANGIITPEEGVNYPRKNVITRALQGKSVKASKPDIRLITDIRQGDYFFLCTDGILESVNSGMLVEILDSDKSDANKMNEIKSYCEISSKDNYTAILIGI